MKNLLLMTLSLSMAACQTVTSVEDMDVNRMFDEEQGGGVESTTTRPRPDTPIAGVPSGDLVCTWEDRGVSYNGRCTNGLAYPTKLYVVTYIVGAPQTRYGLDSVVIQPGETKSASAPWPTCADTEDCKLKAQGDGTADHEPPLLYTFPDRMDGFITGSGYVKDIGPCPCTNYWCQPERKCVKWGEALLPTCKPICVLWETTEHQHTGRFPGAEGCPPSYNGRCDGRSERAICPE